ncbi:TonB-dependent receptor [Dyadobacter sp. LHD-138]|uniref:TonB-dependent receptor n=1 Tax=Dyadobacter sp. LHD-138 TaxID=3071413 RepID=UPI0027DF1228|nr:TonB-dependent receptor [Dyadobacter sp. LHD-138]MDQ6481104.1 TonB-dependent receptor [Dyadobacter sp. LHD-138]
MKISPKPTRILFEIMRISIYQVILCFVFSSLAVASDGKAQELLNRHITLDLDEREISVALRQIGKQASVRFMYSPQLIPADRKVSLHVRNEALHKVLESLFKPLGIGYEVLGKHLILNTLPGLKPVVQDRPAEQKPIDKIIRGSVSDEKGEKLPGVSIVVKGTQRGSLTDSEGKFEFSIPDENTTLIFSFVGYLSQEILAGSQSALDVVLKDDLKSLQEVVVVGYGTQKKVNLTGSVASVDGKELLKAPSTNITNSLVGRLPGLIAVNGNGKPGAGSSISIRGASTFGDNSALIVVDGIVRTFDQIDPNEVESISILKDASATAVYGSRAANGVVLVTTKRGTSGKPTFNYNGFVGIQQPTRYPKVLNGYQYATTKNQALRNLGKPLQYTDQQLEDIRTGIIPEYDWYGMTLKKQSFQTQQNLSVNGGSDAIKYFLSLGYLNQDGMYDQINFQRYSIRTNVDARINKHFTISADIDASVRNTNESAYAPESIFDDIVAAYPLDKAYNPDGTIFYTREQHPVEEIKTGYNRRKNNILQATLSLKHDLPFIKGLSLAGRASFGKEYSNNKHYNVPIFMNRQDADGNTLEIYPYGGWNGKTALNQAFGEYNTTTLNVSLNYLRTFGAHEFGGLLLFEQLDAKGNNFYGFRTNFPAQGLDEFFFGGESQKDANGGSFTDGRRGAIARFNYSYQQRYLLEASFRRDGSVAFPTTKKYGFFPAVSAGWRLSEESFLKNSAALFFVDNLKLRASYGVVGNDRNVYNGYLLRNPTFQYLQVYNPSGAIVSGNEGFTSITPGILPNPNVTWETAAISDAGLEGSLWKGKLQFEIDLFYKRTSNILRSRIRSIPGTLGAQLPAENYAKVDNKGIEFSLTHQNNIQALKYFVKLNGSFSRSKVIVLDEPANTPDYLLQTGRPLGFVTGYKALGFFQTDEEVAAYFPQFNGGQKAGDVKYADINGDKKVNASDLTIISMDNNVPKIIGGLSFGGSLKGFDLNVLFQAAGKIKQVLYGAARDFFQNGSRNTYVDLLDHWSPENPNALYPRPWEGANPNNSLTSSLYLRDGSYIKLRSIDVGYSLPSDLVKKMGVRNVRFYFSGANLFVWSKMKMFDPEIENTTGTYYPQQRTLNLGLNLTF